jgi:putative drug exporter of the RND superfamily
VIVMLAAVWMLPALLGLLGARAIGWRLPWGRKPGSGAVDSKAWTAYGHFLQKRPLLPVIGALALITILAIPALSLRQGFTDNSGKAEGSPARVAYDLRAEGFGAGASAPYLAVVDLSASSDPSAYLEVITALNETPGVAGTNPSLEVLPILAKISEASSEGDANPIQVMAVYPTTAPQDAATSELLTTLREDVNPALEATTGAVILMGGTAAITADFTTVLSEALPVFLLLVVGLGFLALVVLFRSLLVPLIGAVTSLFSLAAAMGISVAVFQWGWFNAVLGIPGTGPILPFIPIMVFAILFGLSMDYQVFLVSRMQEEWAKTHENAASIRSGLSNSGRVVVIAALIMAVVFGAFAPAPDPIIKLFGIALASAVLIDAFIIRLVLVPSLMTLFGTANWWLPGWLDRILPKVQIEPDEEEVLGVDNRGRDGSPQPVG